MKSQDSGGTLSPDGQTQLQEHVRAARRKWSALQQRLNADGLAIWFFTGKQTIYLRYQDSFPADQLQHELQDWRKHGQLLLEVARDGEPRVVEPGWEAGDAGNPTPCQLLIAAERVEGNQFAIVELIRDPTTVCEANELRDVVEAAHAAAEQERVTQIQRLRAERTQTRRRDRFAISVHRSLDPQRVAYNIANSGRQLIECDRVSVALPKRGRMRIAAVSGQTELNPRSNQVRLLELLIRRVVESDQAVLFGSSVSEWPEPVKDPLTAYTTESGARALLAVPLKWADNQPAVGALVIEKFEADTVTERFVEDSEFVARHATLALRNAQDHSSIFLHSARRRIGRTVTGTRWLRRLTMALMLIVVVTALTVIPMELRIEGTGTLRPAQRRGVFAPQSGTIVDVSVENGSPVTAGQTLAVLDNPEIPIWQDHLAHDLSQAEESLRIREAEVVDLPVGSQRRIELEGEIAQFREQVESLRRQVALMEERVAEMTLTAPIDGVVATWDAERQLLNRTVTQGDLLLVVNDNSHGWQADIRVPDRDSGDVLAAWRARPAGARGLPVDYILATHPERRYRGWLTGVENRTETLAQEQVVYMTVVPDEEDPPPLRDGAEVRAKIRCGNRSMGAIWARDVIRFVQARILF